MVRQPAEELFNHESEAHGGLWSRYKYTKKKAEEAALSSLNLKEWPKMMILSSGMIEIMKTY